MLQTSIPDIDGAIRGTYALLSYLLCFVLLSRNRHEIKRYNLWNTMIVKAKVSVSPQKQHVNLLDHLC